MSGIRNLALDNRRLLACVLAFISASMLSPVQVEASYSNCVTSKWVVPCPWNPALDVQGSTTYCVYRSGAVSGSSGGGGTSNRIVFGPSSGSGGGGGNWSGVARSVDEEVCRPEDEDADAEPCAAPKVMPSKSDCDPTSVCSMPKNAESVNSYVDLWGLRYFDTYNDILVAAPGGWLSVPRTYTNGAWRSEGTNQLVAEPPTATGLKRIKMSGRVFTQTQAGGTTYTSSDYIIEATEGPTWAESELTLTEPDGSWLTYRGTVDEGALLLRSGFKGNVYLIYEYDWANYIEGAKAIEDLRLLEVSSGLEVDGSGNPKILLTYTYAPDDFNKNGHDYPMLKKVESSVGGLAVEYDYYDGAGESGLLKTVRKADGTRSEYTYDDDDNLRTKIEFDSHVGGEVVESATIEYQSTKLTAADAVESDFMLGAIAGPTKRVASVTNGAGITKTFSGAYNANSGGYYSRVSYSNGLTKEVWLDDENELLQRSLNGEVVYNRARVGRVERITTRGNSVTVEEYDEFENLIRRTSPLGHVTSWTYSGKLERMASHTDALGATTTYSYDDDLSDNFDTALHEPTIKLAPYHATRAVRVDQESADGNLTRTSYEYYDDLDRLVLEIDARGQATAFKYQEMTPLIVEARRLDLSEDFVRYTQTFDARGQLASRTDANGETTTYDYDASGRLLSMTNPLQETTRYTYSGDDLVEIEEGITPTQPKGRITRYTYDGDGRRTAEFRVDENGTEHRYMSYAYDGEGNLVRTTNADGLVTEHAYDSFGNRSETRLPLPAANTLDPSASENPTHAVTSQKWNVFGDLVETTSASGLITTYTYDKVGRMASMTEGEDTTDGEGADEEEGADEGEDTSEARTIRYRYDALGNQTETIYEFSQDMPDENGDAVRTSKTITTYDGFGRRIAVSGYGVYPESYTYDANDNLLTSTNAKGLTTRFVYDAFDRVDEVYEEYEQDGSPVSILVADDDYDANGNRIRSTDAAGTVVEFAYDALNRLTDQSVPLNTTNQTTSDDAFTTSPDWWTDFANIAQTTTYNRFGEVATVKATHGQLTTNTYDAFGRLDKVTLPTGATIDYDYTAADQIRRIKFPPVSTSGTTQGSEQVFTYDPLNPAFVTAVTRRSGETTAYKYDSALRRAQVNLPMGGVRTLTFDSFNRLTAQTDYHSLADLQAGTAYRTTAYTNYDDFDRPLEIELPGGEGTQFIEYDDKGQTLAQDGANTYPVEYAYDPVGSLEALITRYGDADPNVASTSSTTWEYDARGRLERKVYDDGSDIDYTYHDNGRLHTRTDNRGNLTTYAYDAWGNPTHVDYTPAAGQIARDIEFTYLKGRRQTMADYGGSTTWTYHPNSGLPASEVRTPSVGDATTVAWTYDSEGRRTRMTVDGLPAALQSGEWETIYNYDRYGRLELLQDDHAHATQAFVYGYHATSGMLDQIDSPWQQTGASSYLRDTRTYDAFGRLTERKTVDSSDTDRIGVTGITYGAMDRRTGRTLFGGTLYATQQSLEFDYDAFGQLKEVGASLPLDPATADPDFRAYAFDPIGNRLETKYGFQGSETYAESAQYQPDALNQYTGITDSSTVNPVYDDDGNLTDDGEWDYTWDVENRLVQAEKLDGSEQLRFIYDGLGRRVAKEVYTWNGSDWDLHEDRAFIYDGWNMIAELKTLHPSNFTLLTSYTWGLDLSGSFQGAGGVGGLLAVTESDNSNDSTYMPAYDFNGNIMGYFDTATESLVAEFEYGPFGELIRATGAKADEFNFRFSTKYEDAETGLLYYGFRYYDPGTGRWPSRDPIGEFGGLNLYGMVGNDPISAWDYLGLMDPCPKDCDFLRSALNDAHLAAAAYTGNAPAGYDTGRNWIDDHSGFQAYEFIPNDGSAPVIAFAGTNFTDVKGDWTANSRQFLNQFSGQYFQASEVGRKNSGHRFIGHSLGGGLAHVAGLMTGRDTSTFNSAALSNNTRLLYDRGRDPAVTNITVKDDILTYEQRHRIASGSLYSGKDFRIPNSRDRKGGFETWTFPWGESEYLFRIEMHSMDSVIQSLNKLIRENCK